MKNRWMHQEQFLDESASKNVDPTLPNTNECREIIGKNWLHQWQNWQSVRRQKFHVDGSKECNSYQLIIQQFYAV